MHFLQEVNYINGMIQLYVVEFIRYGQVNKELIVICFGDLLRIGLVHIEEGIVYRMKHYDDLELTTSLLFGLTEFLETYHLLLKYPTGIVSDKSLLALIHHHKFIFIAVLLIRSLSILTLNRFRLQP